MNDSALADLCSTAARRTLARKLLAWFGRSARDLPWRRTKDLFAIWVSEVMLQQTQVATVVPFYNRFLREFPGVAQLAEASEEQVLRLWEGLGYYRRARQMHAAARKIATEHGGIFPTTYDAVRGLPGIGRYTAGAILSIGLDARLPILEANTIRVLSRLSAFRGDPLSSAGQKHLWRLAEKLLPAANVGAFNQGLMELGSEICTPKAPACDRCPIAAHCLAFASGLQQDIPVAAKKTRYEEVTEVAVIVRRGGRLLLRKCRPGERWAGLWDFPRFARASTTDLKSDEMAARVAALTGVEIGRGEHVKTLKHGVTRFRITLECYVATAIAPANEPRRAREVPRGTETRWATTAQLAELPLSSTGRILARIATTSSAATRRTSRSAAAPPARSARRRG